MNRNSKKKLQTIREHQLTISRAIDLTTRNVLTVKDCKTAQDIVNHPSRVHSSADEHDFIDAIIGQIKYNKLGQACPGKEILCELDWNRMKSVFNFLETVQ
jgi:hypothetical protein